MLCFAWRCYETNRLDMDPLFKALSLYRRRKYEECASVCTEELVKSPLDQVTCQVRGRK